jgi:L-lactate dehydrogenase complex protein LldG
MDLVSGFEQAARAAGATVECVPRSSRAIREAVERVLGDAQRVAIAEPVDLPEELLSACKCLPGVVTDRSKRALSACDAGITEAFSGVARTGSLCVSLEQADLGSLSLLVRTHIALLRSEDIVERPRDLFRQDCLGGKGLQRNFVFVTGPSATADMGPLVQGVHGPHRLHILILAQP